MHESYTDWALVSLSPLSRPTLVVAALAVVAAMLLVLWSYRGARRSLGLMLVRAAGALLLLGFLSEPALQLRVVRKIKNRLAVVVDRSRSMGLADPEGESRYDAVLAALAKERQGLSRLGEAHIIDWFDLAGPISSKALNEPPKGESSDLLTAIEKAREAGGGKPLAGIVLISDGADTANLEGDTKGELSAQARARLARLGAPVNTVIAQSGGFRDIAITQVRNDEFAFVHNTFEVEVTLSSVGFAGTSLPVTMKREGEVVASQSVVLDAKGGAKLVLKSKPDKIGELVYSVSIPQLAGEAVAENNERTFVLQVIRDKIRVLQVVGRPSWDERFLRQHLKENPNVDLISFFILRTPTDIPGAPENELSLIPFPVEKLFTTELRSFDVVIFQNFDYRPYKMRHYLANIRDAVTQAGLGFVMVGGEESFGGGGYMGTELEEILPLIPDSGETVQGAIGLQLTGAGRRHPVVDLTRGTGSNDAAWKQLGSWLSANRTGGAAAGATVLLSAPGLSLKNGNPLPLIAVMEAGQGRTMAIATDSMWRWRFSNAHDGGASERAYHRFWSNALRWLVRDPEHSRVRVTPEKRRFEVGEPVEVGFSVLGQDYQPVSAAHIRASVTESTSGGIRLDDLTTDEGGMARHRYTDLPEGAYRVSAEASASGKQVGTGQGVFVVESRSPELVNSAPRPELLTKIAKATGGRSVEMASMWSDLELVDPEVIEIDRRRNIELWDNAWALLAAVVLLAADWAIRRRRGYL